MPTQAEIEAAAKAVASVRSGVANWRLYVKTVTVALETAERVRASSGFGYANRTEIEKAIRGND